jgi:hypothetical protein
MDNIFPTLLIVTLLVISLGAYFLVIGVFFPNRIAKTQHAAAQLPWRSLGLGFVNLFFFGSIGIALLSVGGNAGGVIQGILFVPAFLIQGVLAVLLSLGLTGIVNDLGARLFADAPAWKQTVWGSVTLTFACGLPFIGWFLLLPGVICLGIGATILGFFQREAEPRQVPVNQA